MPRTILLVEDEPTFSGALTIGLRREGFDVVLAENGPDALKAFSHSLPDMVLLDLMLPGKMSGIDVCREIRRVSTIPIIVVTARDSEVDSVVALEVGADDFVRKPFGLRELVARIRAILRRMSGGPIVDESEVTAVQDVVVDSAAHRVLVGGEDVLLSRKEFELLEVLVKNAGRVMTRQALIDRVWGIDYFGDTITLNVHITRLRSKIEAVPSRPTKIKTVRGVGYKFEASEKAR